MILTRTFVPQQNGTLTVLGDFGTIINEYAGVKPAKSGLGYNLVDAQGNMTFVGRSKPLDKALKSGDVKLNQLEHCIVIDGKNAAGEARYYLALPADYNGQESVAEFKKRISGGGRPKARFDAASALAAV